MMSDSSEIQHVLFICAGNVARSQMAEAYFNHFTGSNRAASAGLQAHTPAKYGTPFAEAVTVMREDGIDISTKRVKTVTPEMVALADAIIILCPAEEIPDYITSHEACHYWDVPDPFESPLDGFRSVRDQIRSKVEEIVRRKSMFEAEGR